MLKVDAEFKELIPALNAEEYAGLEASLLAEGCRDALVVWGDVIVDGHNRYEICQRHGISFKTVQKDFGDRNAVKLWIIDNQLARRNLNMFTRAELVDAREEIYKRRAADNLRLAGQLYGENHPKLEGFQNSGKALDSNNFLSYPATKEDVAYENKKEFLSQRGLWPIHTDKELAKDSGISHDSIHKARYVRENAPASIIEKARNDTISTHRAYQLTKSLKDTEPAVIEAVAKWNIDEPEAVDILKQVHKRDSEKFEAVVQQIADRVESGEARTFREALTDKRSEKSPHVSYNSGEEKTGRTLTLVL